MNIRKVTAEVRMAQWAQIIQERIASGESIKTYCENRGIGRDAFFYWQRKLRIAACEQLAGGKSESARTNLPALRFAEVQLQEPCTQAIQSASVPSGRINIKINGIQVAADGAYPVGQLWDLLRELVQQC